MSTALSFQERVTQELRRARGKHVGVQGSAHEGYAVLLEEVDEFWDVVKSQTPKNARGVEAKRVRMLEELVQIAAMAQRTAEDLGLLDRSLGPQEVAAMEAFAKRPTPRSRGLRRSLTDGRNK